MDPISLARSAISVAVACKELFLFFKKVRDGDPLVAELWKQFESLGSTVQQVKAIADSGNLEAEDFYHRKALQDALKGCQDALHEVTVRLKRPDSRQRRDILEKAWTQFKLTFEKEEIDAVRSQIAWSHRRLGLALQTIEL
jgi:hypothetical protein